MIYLTKSNVILINRMTIQHHGGNFVTPLNLLNEHALDYLIEIIDSSMFGEPLYPEIHHKAGLYIFNIISNHIFSDGNKRTGLEAGLLFLKLNGYILSESVDNATLTNLILSVASGEQTLEQVQEWIRMHAVNRK
jgi:death-on-curing protein